MKRIYWIILAVAVLVLLGGGMAVWRTKTESLVIPAEDTSSVPEEPVVQEDSGEVLAAMPESFHFTDMARDRLHQDAESEAEYFTQQMITVLESVQHKGELVQTGLEQNDVHWCAALPGETFVSEQYPQRAKSDEEYQNQLQEEREIRDAKEASQSYERWDTWLVRLMGLTVETKKSKRKAVEEFQKSFNDITDQYEETIAQATTNVRESVDRLTATQKEGVLLPQQLATELNHAVTVAQGACDAGQSLSAGETTQALKAVSGWQTKVSKALQQMQSIAQRIKTLPNTTTNTYVQQTKAQEKDFTAARQALEQVFQSQ